MLAVVSPGVRSTNERHENIIINEMDDDDDVSFGIGIGVGDVDVDNIDFVDFGGAGGANLLEGIDFEDLFVGISTSSDDNHEDHHDVLPDLEMDSEILAEFSSSLTATATSGTSGEGADHHHQESHEISSSEHRRNDDNDQLLLQQEQHQHINPNRNNSSSNSSIVVSDDDVAIAVSSKSVSTSNSSSSKDVEKGRKSSSGNTQSKNNNPPGKRKVKVDWTPELHRRFVQAVEQLGVDKAVPSRILELMGIDCLTRHNIASHLQKYRSHRKHLLAREAEAANWSQRRQLYGGGANIPVAATGRGGGGKRDMNPWIAAAPPTMGFPPHMPPPPVLPMPHFRPLHVWGHPSVDQSLVHLWPKHSPPPAVPPASAAAAVAAWPPLAPSHVDPSFWHSHHQRLTNPLTPGPPCFTAHLAPSPRFPTPPVPGIPSPPTIYKVDPGIFITPPTSAGQPLPQPPAADFLPSKESIDAAIGDAFSKPWQPLPLGLKPPSVDSVLVELQRHGVPKVPPVCVSN